VNDGLAEVGQAVAGARAHDDAEFVEAADVAQHVAPVAFGLAGECGDADAGVLVDEPQRGPRPGAAAVPVEIRAAVLPLYVALMALIGGSSVALGGLGLYLTFGPLRSGAGGAATALASAYSVAFLTAAFVAERLARDAGAPTSWHIMGILMAINAFAYWGWSRRDR
jgi:hypothetical protein